MKADLHVHTTASDGVLTPYQAVERAKLAGLAAVGTADHDTVGGLDEAIAAGKSLGIEAIPAIEFSTELGPLEIHILGYFFDWTSPELLKRTEFLQNARLRRGEKIVEKLRAIGVPVTMERVLEIAGGGSVGRPHIAIAIKELGLVNNISVAFGRYLGNGAPAYVERAKLNPADAIGVIKRAGGVAGIAHPGSVGRDEIIPELVKAGMGAIEVYHPDHAKNVRSRYHAIARRYALIATGGSDAHGLDPTGSTSIGCATADMTVVEALRAASPAAQAGL